MIRVLAIDDEPLALRQLVTYISKVPFLTLAAECQSALDARQFLCHDSVDAIFCDINMPDLDGMTFVKSLASPPLIVFTTAYSEYAVEGFRVEAVDYLLKPFGLDEFRRSAERLRQRLSGSVGRADAIAADDDGGAIGNSDTLFVRTDHRNVAVEVGNILYIQGLSEYVRIHLTTGERPITTLIAMKALEERLPQSAFMRIHRSYIISLAHIAEFNKNRIVLSDGTDLPIGEAYRPAFEAYTSSRAL